VSSVQGVARIGRRVGVGTGAGLGALMGAGFGLFFGFLGLLVTLAAGNVVADVGLFVVLPGCVLGGAFLGARLFLRYRRLSNRLRLRHPWVGALAWVFGSVLLALLAAIAAAAVYATYTFVFD